MVNSAENFCSKKSGVHQKPLRISSKRFPLSWKLHLQFNNKPSDQVSPVFLVKFFCLLRLTGDIIFSTPSRERFFFFFLCPPRDFSTSPAPNCSAAASLHRFSTPFFFFFFFSFFAGLRVTSPALVTSGFALSATTGGEPWTAKSHSRACSKNHVAQIIKNSRRNYYQHWYPWRLKLQKN